MILASLISRLDVGFVFFKWVALVFCPRRPRGLVRASSGALVWKPVICGCCRVTSQKKLSYRLQALSSLFFEVMPSIHRIRLDGWFSRCRGQSSGKSASRQRASQERRSTRKVTSGCSRAVQESQAMFKRLFKRVKPCSRDVQERELCDWARCFQQSNLACPRAACRIRLSVWGGAAPMSRLSGVDVQVIQYFIHSVEDTNLQIIYMFSNTWCWSLTVINIICYTRCQLFLETKHRI